jgi:hypothetical protein
MEKSLNKNDVYTITALTVFAVIELMFLIIRNSP